VLQEQSLLRTLMSSDDPLGDIAIVERVVQEQLLDGQRSSRCSTASTSC
jgi:hypothetical protein